MHHRTLHRALLIAALAAGAWTATELATDDSAHADTPPAVTIERPALLEHAVQLPDQASTRAKAVTAKVTAEPTPPAPAEPQPEPSEDQADEPTPAPPAEPEPTTEPEPAPSDEPTPPADETPVELPPVEVPLPTPTPTEPLPTPVELPPVEAPLPTPVEVPPLPAPPVELPPPPQPAPLPTPPVELPVVAVVAVVAPVAADPIPAPSPAGAVAQLIADLTAGTDQAADCDDTPDDARHIDRDALRHLLAGIDHEPPPAPSVRKPAAPGCPGTPDRGTPGGVQVKPPPPSAAEMVVAYLARSHVPPVLGRLEHTRARSHLPAGRSPHIEPSPA